MMKKTMAVLGLALVFAVVAAPADAQQRRQGGMSLDDQMAQLTEALDMDDEQAKAVRVVLEGQMAKMQEMRANAGGDREGMRAAMMEIREQTSAELAEILSKEQMTKYTELMAQRRGPPF